MPYITQRERDHFLDDGIFPVRPANNAGQLNYQLTELCEKYLYQKRYSYQTMNDIIGALEGCKLEFYRRVAVPYEDKKIEENGDVY